MGVTSKGWCLLALVFSILFGVLFTWLGARDPDPLLRVCSPATDFACNEMWQSYRSDTNTAQMVATFFWVMILVCTVGLIVVSNRKSSSPKPQV